MHIVNCKIEESGKVFGTIGTKGIIKYNHKISDDVYYCYFAVVDDKLIISCPVYPVTIVTGKENLRIFLVDKDKELR